MRESLTIFAIAIILVLSTLLVGPYLIDWNGQRAWLSAKLSKAIGAQVRIDGPIDVKLLPRPILRAMTVSIDAARPHQPRFSAQRLDAELSLNGLLQGAVEFVEARIVSPRIELTMGRDGSVHMPTYDVSRTQKIQFNRLIVSDATLAVLDENGAERSVLSGLSASGEAETLLGPWKLSGSADGATGPVTFRMTTGTLAAGKLRARLVLDRKGDWTHAEADGSVTIGSPTPVHGAGIGFDGDLKLQGALHVADGAAPVPWGLVATGLTADPQNVAAPAIELRAGADARALVASGGALVSLQDGSAAILNLRARQLDLDHLAVAPEVAPDTPRPSAAQWLAWARGVTDGAAVPDMRLTVETAIDAVTTGDLTLTDAAIGFVARPGMPPSLTASIAGPEGTRVALDGTVETGAVPTFKGSADVATRNIATVAGWLEPLWAGIGEATAQRAQGRAFALKGQVDLSSVGAAAREATLTVGGAVLTGPVSFTAGVGSERPRLFADVVAEGLDLEQRPDGRQLAALVDPFDLSIALRSDSLRLKSADFGPADTGRLSLHLGKTGDVVKLDHFEFSGPGGASLTASGALEADKRITGEGRATARDGAVLVRLARQLIPGTLGDSLLARAGDLSPVDVDFRADARLDDDAGLVPLKVSGSGTVGLARFSGSVAPALHGGSSSPVDVELALDAADAGQALAQWGWHFEGWGGALHADVHGSGSLADGFEGRLAATVPGARLAFQGRAGGEAGQGRLTAGGSDSAPLLRAAGQGKGTADRAWTLEADLGWDDATARARNLTARIGGSAIGGDLDYARASADSGAMGTVNGSLTVDSVDLTSLAALGLGRPASEAPKGQALWSSLPFDAPPAWPASDLNLKIGLLHVWPGVVARDAGLTLSLRPGSVTLSDLSARALGGSIGGTVTFRRNGPGASAAGQGSFDGLSVALPGLVGRLSGTLNLAGSGSSAAAVAGSLAGDGALTLAGATLPRTDPGALAEVAADFNAENAVIEDGPVRDALSKALDRGPLVLGDIHTPATVAAGVVRVPDLDVTVPDAQVSADAALDLADLGFTLRTTLTATAQPKDWRGDPPQLTLTSKGPLDEPTRDLDAGLFLNGIAARAIAREQDRIELMKDDLRERAFFARRLRQIEAEQQAARVAAQLQKAVPQPPVRSPVIRLPKPPEVPPPTIAPAASETSPTLDAISRFLGNDQPMPPPGAPLQIAPIVPQPVKPPTPGATTTP